MVFSPTKANGCTKCEQNQLNIIPSLNNIMTSLVCTSTSLIVNVRVNDVPIGSAYRMCLSGSGSFRHKLVLWRNHGTGCYYHSISFHILPQNLIQMQFSDLVVWIEHPSFSQLSNSPAFATLAAHSPLCSNTDHWPYDHGVCSVTGMSWYILSWLIECSLRENSWDLHSGLTVRSGILLSDMM